MRPILFSAMLFAFGLASASAITIPFTESFTSNSTAPEWQVVEDAPSQIFLSQGNGTLRVIAPGSSHPANDALYLSNGPSGFAMLTSSNFEIRIDYSFASYVSSVVGGQFGLVFGVGRDVPDGTDSAAIGYGYVNTGFGVVGSATTQYRDNDVPSALTPIAGGNSGTFVVTYTASTDRLTLGIDGAGSTNYDGVVQGLWGAPSLYVSFGGRGAGFVTSGANAFFDNFQVLSGAAIAVPEPGALSLAGLGLFALTALRFRRHRRR